MNQPIVFATDFSPISDEAQLHAVHLAQVLEAPLRLLHVIEAHGPGGPDQVFDVTLEANIASRVRELFEEREAMLEGCGVEVQRVDRRGITADEILSEVQAVDAQALVLGTHAYGGFRRFFAGSVAVYVMRRTTCPALIVPTGCTGPPWSGILYPTDFSPLSNVGLEYAIDMAERTGTPLEIFHAEIPYESSLMVYGLGDGIMGDIPAEGHLCDAKMEELAARARLRGVETITTRVLEPTVGHAIVKRAQDRDCSAGNYGVIVMAAHGRTGFERFIHGSVTEDVLTDAARPILVLPNPDSE